MSLRSDLSIVWFESSGFFLDFFFPTNLLVIEDCVLKSHTIMKTDPFFPVILLLFSSCILRLLSICWPGHDSKPKMLLVDRHASF